MSDAGPAPPSTSAELVTGRAAARPRAQGCRACFGSGRSGTSQGLALHALPSTGSPGAGSGGDPWLIQSSGPSRLHPTRAL
jgi:hypothetical protein